MKYCPDCGTGHECTAEQAADRTELAIAKVQADRDIRLAEIKARAGVTIAETEAEHLGEHADGVLEGIDAALGTVAEDDADDAGEPDGADIIVDTDAGDEEPEPEAEPDNAPPEVIEVPEPAAKRGGWWGAYR